MFLRTIIRLTIENCEILEVSLMEEYIVASLDASKNKGLRKKGLRNGY
jgi:hypothetical protein